MNSPAKALSFEEAAGRCKDQVEKAEVYYNAGKNKLGRCTKETANHLIIKVNDLRKKIQETRKPEDLPELLQRCYVMANAVKLIVDNTPHNKIKKKNRKKDRRITLGTIKKKKNNKKVVNKGGGSKAGQKTTYDKELKRIIKDEGLEKVKRDLESLAKKRKKSRSAAA